MDSSKNMKYNGEYLERYRKGELSASECHALEKASLSDPLLAEALEGYHSCPRSSAPELNFLKQWVGERVEENQAAIRFIPKKRSYAPLMRAAAVFLLLIGAAWLSYVLWLEPTQQLMADNRSNTPPSTQINRPQKENIPSASERTSLPPTPPNDQTTAPPQQTPKEILLPQATKPVRPMTPADERTTYQEATVSADKTDLEVMGQLGKETPRQAEDLSAKPITSRAQLRAVEIKSLPENKNTEAEGMTDGPLPVVGWTSYENYLSRNREAAPTASNTQTNILVILTFEVGNDGRPREIQVERSAGTYYDQKAIDLLKKGPGWIPAKNGKRAELRVPFQ